MTMRSLPARHLAAPPIGDTRRVEASTARLVTQDAVERDGAQHGQRAGGEARPVDDDLWPDLAPTRRWRDNQLPSRLGLDLIRRCRRAGTAASTSSTRASDACHGMSPTAYLRDPRTRPWERRSKLSGAFAARCRPPPEGPLALVALIHLLHRLLGVTLRIVGAEMFMLSLGLWLNSSQAGRTRTARRERAWRSESDQQHGHRQYRVEVG